MKTRLMFPTQIRQAFTILLTRWGVPIIEPFCKSNAGGGQQVTETNAYGGNNGRAAILANNLYYMAGNSNNGSGTPANVVASAGVEVEAPAPGQVPGASTELGIFSITQITNLATGKPYKADKLGKDNTFQGLTIFDNTLYLHVTKGSGGNGINTVYQVGSAGTLPALTDAPNAPIKFSLALPQRSLKPPAQPTRLVFGLPMRTRCMLPMKATAPQPMRLRAQTPDCKSGFACKAPGRELTFCRTG